VDASQEGKERGERMRDERKNGKEKMGKGMRRRDNCVGLSLIKSLIRHCHEFGSHHP